MSSRRLGACLLGVVALALLGAAPGAGAPRLHGVLDSSFGNGGRVVTELGPTLGNSQFTSMVRQPDGKLVLIARVGNARGESGWAVERRDATGGLDPAFGDGGVLEARRFDFLEGLAVKGDGQILIGVPLHNELCAHTSTVEALGPSGAPDPGFSGDGVSPTLPLTVRRMAIDSEGRILLAGNANFGGCGKGLPPTFELALARLRADGEVDLSFGTDGLVRARTEDELEDHFATGVAGLRDGGILVTSDRSLLRYTPDGDLDKGFGKGGVAPIGDVPKALLALPDGGAVVASSSSHLWPSCCQEPGDLILDRFRPDGQADPGFGTAGHLRLDVGSYDEPTSLAPGPDGGFLLAGGVTNGDCRAGKCTTAPFLARFGANGALDPGFGQEGRLSIDTGGESSYEPTVGITAMAIGAGGRIVAATSGEWRTPATVIAREPGGQPDLAFGTAGMVEDDRPLRSTTSACGLASGAGGRVFASVWTNSGAHRERTLFWGLGPDGGFDPVIGAGDGFVAANVGCRLGLDAQERVYSAMDSDLARFDGRGRPDSSYGSDGLAPLPSGFEATSLRVAPDGATLVTGSVDGRRGMAVFRLTPDGRPDAGFGDAGLALVGSGRKVEAEATAAAVDAGGRVVLAGKVDRGAVIARLLPDGRLDRGFAERGRRGDFPDWVRETAIALQPNGKLVVALSPGRGSSDRLTRLVRLDLNGVRDRGFARRGAVRVIGGAPLLALFADGRQIVLATPRFGTGSGGVALRSFSADGSVDRRFGRGGVAVAGNLGPRSFRPAAVTRQADGRIVVAGTIYTPDGIVPKPGSDVGLLRFR